MLEWILSVWFLVSAGDSVADGMSCCPEVHENSTFGELSMAWMCDLMKWRGGLYDLKMRVEQECNVSETDDFWRDVFECPNFSDIECDDNTPPLNETDALNCSISFCVDGNYSDGTFLRNIWLHHFHTNRKFMNVFRSNLSHCLRSPGPSINEYMTSCPDVNENSTNSELSVAWTCESIIWRKILAEWKQTVEEECTVDADQETWKSMFQCPDYSHIECLNGIPRQNETDLLNCSTAYCPNGTYVDESVLQNIAGQQICMRDDILKATINATCIEKVQSTTRGYLPSATESASLSTTSMYETSKSMDGSMSTTYPTETTTVPYTITYPSMMTATTKSSASITTAVETISKHSADGTADTTVSNDDNIDSALTVTSHPVAGDVEGSETPALEITSGSTAQITKQIDFTTPESATANEPTTPSLADSTEESEF